MEFTNLSPQINQACRPAVVVSDERGPAGLQRGAVDRHDGGCHGQRVTPTLHHVVGEHRSVIPQIAKFALVGI